MKDHFVTVSLVLAFLGGALAWVILENVAIALAVPVIIVMPAFISIYPSYAKDNPNQFWFKRKLYGWGWAPVTWQGWLVTIVYTALIIASALTIDPDSPPSEIAFTFILPVILISAAFIRIAYRKGESPRWQWGEGNKTPPEAT